jgi:hypothetical protein
VDRLDEVWHGVLHTVPAPSVEHAHIAQQLAELLGPLARDAGLKPTVHEFDLGAAEHDFRVPDGGLHRPPVSGVWHATAAAVIEILCRRNSPRGSTRRSASEMTTACPPSRRPNFARDPRDDQSPGSVRDMFEP